LAEAASIPDNFITAFYTLFNQLSLPIPSSFPSSTPPPNANIPILVYGAGATVGQYTIQLLSAAGYTNIVATASAHHHEYLRSLGATETFDYKSPSLVEDVTRNGKVSLVIDCITSTATLDIISKLVSSEGTVALMLPIKEGSDLLSSVMHMEISGSNPLPVGTKHVGVRTFTYQQVRSAHLCRPSTRTHHTS
jgi:NADPH:quinone reductase-like Zn-dependent oxidoreductase